MTQTPITLDTFSALIDYGYTLTSHCRTCNRHSMLDLAALVGRIDRDIRRPEEALGWYARLAAGAMSVC